MSVARRQALLRHGPVHKHDTADEFRLLLPRVAGGLALPDLREVAGGLGHEAIAALLAPPLGLDGGRTLSFESTKARLESCRDLSQARCIRTPTTPLNGGHQTQCANAAYFSGQVDLATVSPATCRWHHACEGVKRHFESPTLARLKVFRHLCAALHSRMCRNATSSRDPCIVHCTWCIVRRSYQLLYAILLANCWPNNARFLGKLCIACCIGSI